ncbi:MAG: monooxygenase family protein [Candidatus Binatia bacterium]
MRRRNRPAHRATISYARSKDHAHLPAWASFYKRVGASRGDVGIWHETYRIGPGRYEAVYGNMPPFGLGAVGRLVPATDRRDTSRGRLESTETCHVIP